MAKSSKGSVAQGKGRASQAPVGFKGKSGLKKPMKRPVGKVTVGKSRSK